MSTLSYRIRAAALGPTPQQSHYLSSWLEVDDTRGCGLWLKGSQYLGNGGGMLQGMTPNERRLFLLNVSEAVK